MFDAGGELGDLADDPIQDGGPRTQDFAFGLGFGLAAQARGGCAQAFEPEARRTATATAQVTGVATTRNNVMRIGAGATLTAPLLDVTGYGDLQVTGGAVSAAVTVEHNAVALIGAQNFNPGSMILASGGMEIVYSGDSVAGSSFLCKGVGTIEAS